MATHRSILRRLCVPALIGATALAGFPVAIRAQTAADVAPPAVASAVEEARRGVDAASQRPEAADELQVAWMNLAVAQYLAGDYVGAEAGFLKVIELVEASGRPTSPRLARAEAGLATTYYAGKRYDLAVQHFDRAVSLSRRVEGLYHEAQLPLLAKYADALTEMGRYDDALKVQRYSLRVVERKYGAGSLDYARQLEAVGRWYALVRAYDASRATLRNAIARVEDLKGEDAVELIGPLTALADCNRQQLLDPRDPALAAADDQRRAMFHDPMAPVGPLLSANTILSEGQKSLERAVGIATGEPGAPPAKRADVLTQLGDWYQSRQLYDKALTAYQQAWQAATGQTLNDKPLTEQLFGKPVLLYYVPPSGWDRYARRPPGEATVLTTTVEFEVTAQGRVAAPRVVSDAGDSKLGAQSLKAVQAARYRPRFANGSPAETGGVKLEQPYYVEVEVTESEKSAGTPGT
jgi:tetratricopeptide (TPR) repeat protein